MLKFLVGNKCDLQHKRKITTDEGKELARQYGIQFFLETSAKDTLNIQSLFEGVTKIFLEKSTANNRRETKKDKNIKYNKGISIENISENSKKKKGCC